MSRLLLLALLVAWAGLALLFAEIPWFQRQGLADRLRSYVPGAPRRSSGIRAAQSLREVGAPLASTLGASLAGAFGVQEDLGRRLERVHASEDATAFRVRQVAWSAIALILSGAMLTLASAPPLVAAVAVWVLPLLTFLVIEQHLATRSAQWKRRLDLELATVEEQLAMLLNAGYSLGAALGRLAGRSDGASAADLRTVLRRVRQGVSEADALDEWARLADVASVERLVAVLRLHGETSELGRLVADEARAAREEAHRRLLATMERKAQAVWVPVTVAALVPGVIFLSVPFLHALTFFASG